MTENRDGVIRLLVNIIWNWKLEKWVNADVCLLLYTFKWKQSKKYLCDDVETFHQIMNNDPNKALGTGVWSVQGFLLYEIICLFK